MTLTHQLLIILINSVGFFPSSRALEHRNKLLPYRFTINIPEFWQLNKWTRRQSTKEFVSQVFLSLFSKHQRSKVQGTAQLP